MQQVRVMLSYDYNHFEVSLGVPDGATLKEMNEARKNCMRLCDEAIRQYKVAKRREEVKLQLDGEWERLEWEAERIRKIPEDERTPDQLAIMKSLADYAHWDKSRYDYDYGDDGEPDWGD